MSQLRVSMRDYTEDTCFCHQDAASETDRKDSLLLSLSPEIDRLQQPPPPRMTPCGPFVLLVHVRLHERPRCPCVVGVIPTVHSEGFGGTNSSPLPSWLPVHGDARAKAGVTRGCRFSAARIFMPCPLNSSLITQDDSRRPATQPQAGNLGPLQPSLPVPRSAILDKCPGASLSGLCVV